VPDYSAVFLPGLTITMTALGDLAGGDPVEVAGSGTVRRCTAGPSSLGSAGYVGIASADTRSGLEVTVIAARVVHEGPADGVITAGDQVMASSVPGRQVRSVPPTRAVPGQADVNQARVIIGVALITAADGATVRWMQM
jgi:hypothetical protein